MPPTSPLLSRSLDPLLGVFTGVLAYQLYESNPRTAPPHDETLRELVKWKWAKWQRERRERLSVDDGGLPVASELLNSDEGKERRS